MINSLSEGKKLIIDRLRANGKGVLRVKETVSEQSIYIFIDSGTIRISDHHNKHSMDRCICSIALPIKEEFLNKMIDQI